ncbi:MAG: Gfo/Idh/MocA family oxidoreductase [Sedimentisphaerales bacterium]|nr:Gfo/Idh/MocA family oxidoreductase [Sedimentisphaerales bacterium]
MKTIRFGIIGCGLMGREFASAAARWCHLPEMDLRPELVSICNRTLSAAKIDWYRDNFPSIKQVTCDYQELLANPQVEAVYCAVPHNFHAEIYRAIIASGKHLLGEKPFGIDLSANEAILESVRAHPEVLVRCASQYIYYPGVQRILQMIEDHAFGRIIEVDSGFLHCSDLDPNKPINWKRTNELNGQYGSMGDLGLHIAVVTARAGWEAINTRAICLNIMSQRPDSTGKLVPCDTWDNATLLTELKDPIRNDNFPWTLRVHRIMPGERNSWYLNIYGTKAGARFSLKNPRQLQILRYTGGEQSWQNIDMGFETAYATITAGIFEFGACDAFMQMMAAFMYELSRGKPLNGAAACPSPEEIHEGHRLFTAALESHKNKATVAI